MIIHNVTQGMPEWLELRAGKPTASGMARIITGTGKLSTQAKRYALQLAAEHLGGHDLFSVPVTPAMERGKDLEAEARRYYGFKRDLDVQEVGFITDDAQTWGVSPDGLVGDDGGLEIKCASSANHLDVWLRSQDGGSPPPDYIPQVQAALLMTERAWWDLLFYHPSEVIPAVVFRVEPDPSYHLIMREALSAVLSMRDDFIKRLISDDSL